MCLIAFAIDAHAACPLLIAANRDEFLDRPTAGLHRWALPSGGEVVAGRDLRDGGTWLGVSPSGRVAMLTNVREAQPGTAPRSRGELVTRWLAGAGDAEDANAWQARIDPSAYGGFNLVVGDFHQRSWVWLSNRHPQHPHANPTAQAVRWHSQRLGEGIYGLSNATLNTPWPKTQRLTRALHDTLNAATVATHPQGAPWWSPLQQSLLDDQPAHDADLPHTGVPLTVERALSSPFVRMPERGYGTRSSLLVRVRPPSHAPWRWQVSLDEWTHAHAAPTEPTQHRHHTLWW